MDSDRGVRRLYVLARDESAGTPHRVRPNRHTTFAALLDGHGSCWRPARTCLHRALCFAPRYHLHLGMARGARGNGDCTSHRAARIEVALSDLATPNRKV